MRKVLLSQRSVWTGLPRAGYSSAILSVALLLLALVLVITSVQASPQALTLTVDSTVDEPDATPGDGVCASTPSGLCTLRAAVQEANALAGADTIVLPSGVYTLTIPGAVENDAASGDLDLLESVTIQGAGAASTAIEANSLDRALQILAPAVVTVTQLTIQGGDSGSESGGGIAQSSGSQLTLEDATVRSNSSGNNGGGIYNNGGGLILRRSQVVANSAANAAGIRNSGSLTVYDSTVAENHATQTAGGILNTGAMALEGATISGNIADTNGGGLYLHSADPVTGLVTILNSTISGNVANSFMGGGIWIYYQTELTATNSTIAYNSAGLGGGVFNYHQQARALPVASVPEASGTESVEQAGNIHLLNTVVASNSFANCGRSDQTEAIHSLGNNLDSGNSCEFAGIGDLVNTDPQLGLLQDNGGPTWTHALLPGSPAIDAGHSTDYPPADQRGVSRPQGSACDIGAYESIPTGEANLALVKTDDPDPVAPSAALTYTLSIANAGPSEATSVEVVDTLPIGVEFGDAAGSGWSCGHASGEVTCTRPSLALGVAPDIVVHVLAPASTGTITNTASVTSTVADPSLGNNLAEESTLVEAQVVEQADLSIAKTGSPNPVDVSAWLTYTLTITNAGPDSASAITMTDTLPPEVTYSDAYGSGWNCGYTGGTVSCTRSSLAAGAEREIVIIVMAPATSGAITNTASVASQALDPDHSNNSAGITILVGFVHRIYLPLVLR